MKKLIIILSFLAISCSEKTEKSQIVEASCGQCQFGLTTPKGCDLAIKIDGKAYFVDGTKITDHGDAHNKVDGFCEVVRKAKVTGKIVDNRFVASSFTIVK
ncbi:MAG: DUF6370 family protein [Flavobacteriaceae bacterium]